MLNESAADLCCPITRIASGVPDSQGAQDNGPYGMPQNYSTAGHVLLAFCA